jgi:hypothetical protein
VKRREFIARHLSLALFMDAKLDLGVKRVPEKPSRNGAVSPRAKSLEPISKSPAAVDPL